VVFREGWEIRDNTIGNWTAGTVSKDGSDAAYAETEYGSLKLNVNAQCGTSAEPGVGLYAERAISPLAGGAYLVQTSVTQYVGPLQVDCGNFSATATSSLILNGVEKASFGVTSGSNCRDNSGSKNLEGCIALGQDETLTIRLLMFVTPCATVDKRQSWGAVSVSLLDPPAQLISVDGLDLVPRGSTTTVTVKTDGPADVALLVDLLRYGSFAYRGTAACGAGSPRECTFSFNLTVPSRWIPNPATRTTFTWM
jgi:hypothetical protein